MKRLCQCNELKIRCGNQYSTYEHLLQFLGKKVTTYDNKTEERIFVKIKQDPAYIAPPHNAYCELDNFRTYYPCNIIIKEPEIDIYHFQSLFEV